MSSNSQHIAEGRSAAMENYVDFSGNKKEWLNSYQKDALSPLDKSKYESYVWVSNAGALVAGSIVAYMVRKKTGSIWKAIGFGLATTAAGYGIGYLATKSYSDKLGAKTGVSSDVMTAMNQSNQTKLNQLKNQALYGYGYGIV